MPSVENSILHAVASVGLACAALSWCGCALPRKVAERLAAVEDTATKSNEAAKTLAKPEADETSAQASNAAAKPEKLDATNAAKPPAEHSKSESDVERTPASTLAAAHADASPPRVDPAALAAVMGQLQELRSVDPAGHDQLLADLKHVDPKLWPMLVQGFKASVEYRQRKQAVLPTAAIGATTPAMASVAALPRPELAAPPPATIAPPATASLVVDSKTQPASAATPAPPADWRQPLEATIRSLEAAVAESPGPAGDDRHVSLRMLYLLAGQRDKALQPLASHDALAQEFWSRELYSLSTYLDAQRVSDRSRRAAEAAQHHWEASHRLGQQANLVVRNLALCTEVMSYGVYTPFERLEFRPGQRAVLYAEVENFVSLPTPRGHHTALASSYQIFDSRGNKVEQFDFPLTEEHCQNQRRDFFIAYDTLRLPAQMYDGKYTLKLTIEDTLGHKVGQSSLDFQIKQVASDHASGVR